MTSAFLPLLHASRSRPKVINVSSSLGSITRVKQWKMLRATAYGVSKAGLNGLTVYMQMVEDERAAKAGVSEIEEMERKVSFYSVEPGLMKTAFTNYSPRGKDPKDGAEVITHLALEEGGPSEGATYWEFEGGRMREVPW
jgi:NAD(P)-dependent dehydrogenase (short-subunit alcohol dehydrogenase family)